MLFQGLATQKKQFPGHTLVRTLGRAHAYHLSRGLVHPNGAHPGMTTPPFASQGLVPWLRDGPSSEGFSHGELYRGYVPLSVQKVKISRKEGTPMTLKFDPKT